MCRLGSPWGSCSSHVPHAVQEEITGVGDTELRFSPPESSGRPRAAMGRKNEKMDEGGNGEERGGDREKNQGRLKDSNKQSSPGLIQAFWTYFGLFFTDFNRLLAPTEPKSKPSTTRNNKCTSHSGPVQTTCSP
jgi:hypothetical protein